MAFGGFGVSVGDLVAVGTFAWNIYKACRSNELLKAANVSRAESKHVLMYTGKNASSDFEEVGHEVVALCTPIKELEDEARNPESILNRAGQSKLKELDELLKNCRAVLRQLEWLLTKYKRLGTQSRRTWDRIKFGSEGLQDVREKLTFHTSAISLFLTTLGTGSLGRIEKKLDEIVEEIRAGKREPTTLSVVDDDQGDAETQWNKLKDELLEEGLTRWEVEAHKSDIKKKLREVVDRGESLQWDALYRMEQTANSISQGTDDAGSLYQAPVSHDFEDNQVNEKDGIGPPTLAPRDDHTARPLATAPETEKQLTDMDSNFPVTNDRSANQGTDSQTLDNIKSSSLKFSHSLPPHCGLTSPYDSNLSMVEENHIQPRGSHLDLAAYSSMNTSGIEQSSPTNTSHKDFTTSKQALTQSVSMNAPRRLPSPTAFLHLTSPNAQSVIPQPTLPKLSNNVDDWNPPKSLVSQPTAGGLTNNQSQPHASHIMSSESPASIYFHHWVPPEQPSLKRQASEVLEYHEETTEYDGSGQVRKRTVIRRSSTPTTVPNSPKYSSPKAFDGEARSIAMGPVSSRSDLVPMTVAASKTADSTPPSATASVPSKRQQAPNPSESVAKRQSKWSPEEDEKILRLRGEQMKWEDISKQLPGRSAISCRLHYQNYLERRLEWDEGRKNKFARLYER